MAESILTPYVKSNLTFEEKIQLVNDWEDWRACDGEFIGDLDDTNDKCVFLNFYGSQTYDRCRKKSRYWMYGYNFYSNEEDKDMCVSAKIWPVMEDTLDINIYLDEILGSYKSYIENKDTLDEAHWFEQCFHCLIDFDSFWKSQHGLSVQEAENKIYDMIREEKEDTLVDAVYSIAQDMVASYLDKIRSREVYDINGTPYDESDEVEWYDDLRDEITEEMFEKIVKACNNRL